MMMKKNLRSTTAALLLAALASFAQAQETVRPEVGKPLRAAQELTEKRQFREALAKLRDADAVSGKTAYESFMVERIRMSAAVGASDLESAQRAFDAIGGSSKISSADKLRMVESLAALSYKAQKYPAAIQWTQRYFRDGGNSAAMRTMLINSMYQSRDYSGVVKEITSDISQAERSGNAPTEDRINLLMNAQLAMKDMNGYVWSLEKLVTYYPKKEYWVNLLQRLQSKKNFSDRFALDTFRLSLVTGGLTKTQDFMEMAQLALQAGYPAEGLAVMEQGYKLGALGNGAEADRQKRLKDLIIKRGEEAKAKAAQAAALQDAESARSGDALVQLGYAMFTQGQGKKGVELMQKGIAKGELRRPEDAKLHMGIAQVQSGETSRGLATLRSVGGTDGSAELAHLWMVYAKRR
jgi:hypothetical protein